MEFILVEFLLMQLKFHLDETQLETSDAIILNVSREPQTVSRWLTECLQCESQQGGIHL